MKIGINARLLYSDKLEGIPRYIYEVTKQMALSHPEDKFILFYDRKHNVKFDFPPNVRGVVVPWHARKPLLWWWWFEVMIPLYLYLYNIDVFFSGDGYLSLSTKTPTVFAVHDLAFLHFPEYQKHDSLRYYQKNTPKFMDRADTIITVSEFTKNDIIKQYSISAEKIAVAYNAYDKPVLVSEEDLPYDIQSPYFLYVGAIHPRKNISTMIEAIEALNVDMGISAILVLAGRLAWSTEQIEKMVNTNPYVRYIGMVTEEQKSLLIQKAKGLVYISYFEGFGIPILEAMAHSTPVITSNVTSMPEVAGDAAILINPNDPIQVATAMKDIFTDEELHERLVMAGKLRYKLFNWQKSGEIIYNSLLKVRSKI